MAPEAVAAAEAKADAAVALIGAMVALPAGMVMFSVVKVNGKLELTAVSVMLAGNVPSITRAQLDSTTDTFRTHCLRWIIQRQHIES